MTETDVHSLNDQAQPAVRPAAGLWSRFWARNTDLMIFWTFVRFLLAPFFPDFFWGTSLWGGIIEAIVLIPLALALDTLVMRAFGTTPGKALWGLSVRAADGAWLGLWALAKRNFGFWLYGFGAGIPFLGIVAALVAYWRSRKGAPAFWDRRAGHQVSQAPIGWVRRIAAFFVALFVLLMVWQIDRSQTASWTNPETGNTIRFPILWKVARPVPEGLVVRAFQEDEAAIVTLKRYAALSISLQTFVENLKVQNIGVLMEETSRIGVGAVGEVVTLSYRMTEDGETLDLVWSVWQRGDDTWILTVVKPLEDAKTRGYAEAAAADILSSFAPRTR